MKDKERKGGIMKKVLIIILFISFSACSSIPQETQLGEEFFTETPKAIFEVNKPTSTIKDSTIQTTTPIPEDVKKEISQVYKVLLFIGGNINALEETAKQVNSGELEGFESLGALIGHAAIAAAIEEIKSEITIPEALTANLEDALIIQDSTKNLISDWLNKEINSVDVIEQSEPLINDFNRIMNDVDNSLTSEYGFNADELQTIKDEALTDINEAFSEEFEQTEETEIPDETNESSKDEEKQIEAQYLGDTTQGYGYGLTALQIIDPVNPTSYYEIGDGNKLIAIEVIIGNYDGEITTSDYSNATLVDSAGYTYPAINGANIAEIPQLSIKAGEQVIGWIAFEVPNDLSEYKSLKYKYTQLGWRESYKLETSLIPSPEGYSSKPILVTPNTPNTKIGDTDEKRGFSLSVLNYEDPTEPGSYFEEKEGYRLVAFEVVLGNETSDEPLSVYITDFSLVDERGFIYEVEDRHGREGQIKSGELDKGEKRKGWVSFIIPKDSNPNYIKYPTESWTDIFLIAGVTN